MANFSNIPIVTITDITPGASQTFVVRVDAAQPPTSALGSLTLTFNGEERTAPLNFTYNTGVIVPAVTADSGTATNIELTVGEPSQTGASTWEFPITATVV